MGIDEIAEQMPTRLAILMYFKIIKYVNFDKSFKRLKHN